MLTAVCSSSHCAIKRLAAVVITLVLCCAFAVGGSATGFSADYEAIDEAAQSVLMLEVYNSLGTMIATGSGFVCYDSKTLVTNYHVIENGSYLMGVTDTDKRYRISKVLCSNKAYDVAILSFDQNTGLKPLKLNCSENLLRGQPVVAIGSPIGIKNTVSLGNISNVLIDEGVPYVQFTAQITNGSSGGALFDDDGYVIGVTAASWTKGQDMNLAVRAKVVQGMYNAWDHKTRSVSSAPTNSRVDLNSVVTSTPKPTATPQPTYGPLPADSEWPCPVCEYVNTSMFCLKCGRSRPDWICKCRRPNIGSFCGSCGTSVEKCVEQFNTAMDCIAKNQFSEAIELLTSLGSFDCGGFATVKGQHEKAADWINGTYYAWGKYLQEKADYEAAVEKYTKAGQYMDAATCVKQNHYLNAESLMAAGQYAQASEAFKKAGNYNDASSRVLQPYYVCGTLAMSEGRYADAINNGFSNCLKYGDSQSLMNQAYYLWAEENYAAGDLEGAVEHYEKAGNYKDAKQKVTDLKLSLAALFEEKGQYTRAIVIYSEYKSNAAAKARIPACYYLAGQQALKNQEYDLAVTYFTSAGSYEGAEEGILAAHEGKIRKLINDEKYDEAYQHFKDCRAANIQVKNLRVIAPGSKGNAAKEVLSIAAGCGFITLPSGESTYQDTYKDGVIKLETLVGAKADGIIYLSEMVTITHTYYPGSKSDELKEVFEKLYKLNYISKLGKDRTVYDKSYRSAVIDAEKNMGLKADGIITPKERAAILKSNKMAAIVPATIAYVEAGCQQTCITFKWPASKGAAWYEIYKNNKLIAKVTKTTYTDKTISNSNYSDYTYKIRACNEYGNSAYRVLKKGAYMVVTAKEMKSKYNNFKHDKGHTYKWKGSQYYYYTRIWVDGITIESVKKESTSSGWLITIVCSQKGTKFILRESWSSSYYSTMTTWYNKYLEYKKECKQRSVAYYGNGITDLSSGTPVCQTAIYFK